MTAETAKQILMIFRGNYPGEGWKLEGDRGKLFVVALLDQLGKYPDRFALRAAQKAIDASPGNIPSIPLMKQIIKQAVNAVPEYRALPGAEMSQAGRQRVVDMVKDVKRKWHSKDGHGRTIADVPDDVAAFARRHFHEISDATIVRNSDVFAAGLCECMKIDGNPYYYIMGKLTGAVWPVVKYTCLKK